MGEDPFKNKSPETKKPDVLNHDRQEQLEIKIEKATSDNWKECKELRVLELTGGKDASKFGLTSEMVMDEEKRGEKEWRKDLLNPEIFFMLSRNGDEVVGMGRAEQRNRRVWHMGWGYTKEEFRNKGFGKKNFAMRLKEIIEQKGKRVTMGVMTDNDPSIHIAETFGFKVIQTFPSKIEGTSPYYLMELNLDDPQLVINKISEVLDER